MQNHVQLREEKKTLLSFQDLNYSHPWKIRPVATLQTTCCVAMSVNLSGHAWWIRKGMENNCWNIFNALDLISAQWDICAASAVRFYSAGALCRSCRILVWNSCAWNCFREVFVNKYDLKWINRQKCFGLVSMWLRLQLELLKMPTLNFVALLMRLYKTWFYR